MTIEEKAKAYDEALERAKAYHRNELAGTRQEMTEYIFPELRESEDERTRKEIIHYLQLVGKGDGDYAQPMIDRWIAWLEQQECGEKGLKGPQEIGDWRGDEGVCKKQKEQKPAEWSEEDEEIRDNIICILQKDVTYTPPTRPNSCTGFGNAFYTHQTEIDWLKSLRPNKQD